MIQQDQPRVVTATIVAENNFTDSMPLDAGAVCSVSVIGSTWSGTVTLQRQLPGQSTWQDTPIDGVTSPDISGDREGSYTADERQLVRIGVKTGDFTGTSVTTRLGKG
jgi:hypothetical protein